MQTNVDAANSILKKNDKITEAPALSEVTCLQDFTDFSFSAKTLVSNNLAGGQSSEKEMRFQHAGDVDGQKFDFVVGQYKHKGLVFAIVAILVCGLHVARTSAHRSCFWM